MSYHYIIFEYMKKRKGTPANEIQDLQFFGEFGGVNPSITDSSTFTYLAGKTMADVFEGTREGCYLYSRHTNPSNSYLGQAIAQMEYTKGAVLSSSGMGAITSTLLQLCSSGDEIISSRTIYGGTYAFMKNYLPKFGINTTFVDSTKLEEIESSINSIFAAVFAVVLINFHETETQLAFTADILSTGLQTLLYNIFVGAGLGILIGYTILRFIHKLSSGQMPHIVMFGSLFFTYAISELLGASGIATALAVGIVFGNSKIQVPNIIKSFGGEMELILVTFVYFILGAIIDFQIMYTYLIPALMLIALVYFVRYIAVRYFTKNMEKLRRFTVLSSPRGITCAVLTLSYSSIFPNPALIIGLVFSVILISSLTMFLIPKSLPRRY